MFSIVSQSRADRARALLNARDNRLCNGTTHVLTCSHSVTLGTRACSTNCCRPQFGNKARRPHVCSICAFTTDEDRLLQEVAAIHNLRFQLEALRSDYYTNPVSSRSVEDVEDLISERETNLQFTVNRNLWLLYIREGEEGVRSQQAARELEEAETLERRYVQVMRREWYSERAASAEEQGQRIDDMAATGDRSGIQALIDDTQGILQHNDTRPRFADLIDEEQARLDVEFAHERLPTLRAAMTVAEALDPREAERHRAAERRRTVERLEFQLAMSVTRLRELRAMAETPTGFAALAQWEVNQDITNTLDAINALRAAGLGDPSEQDTEPGEV